MATTDKDQDKTGVQPAIPEPEDSSATTAPVAEVPAPSPVTPPIGDGGEETASAERSGISAESADSAALAVPSEFTWESLQAAEDAYAHSLAACWPHFAPVRAVRRGDHLEFDEPMPGDWQLLNAAMQAWLLDRWEATAHEGIVSTFQTNLQHAPPPRQHAPPPRQQAMADAGLSYSPEGLEEHATEQFTVKVPAITTARRRALLSRLLRDQDD